MAKNTSHNIKHIMQLEREQYVSKREEMHRLKLAAEATISRAQKDVEALSAHIAEYDSTIRFIDSQLKD